MIITRRALIGSALAAGAARRLPIEAEAAAASSFRFVHFTDIHIQPELRAGEGTAAAVRAVLALRPRPAFIITGGDHVMDLLSVTHERADVQFAMLTEALKPLEMPIYHTVGNHDIFGWHTRQGAEADGPDYGKKMFEERIAKGPSYTSFDHQGRRFIILDTIQRSDDGGWHGEVDDVQLQWFKSELEKAGKTRPIFVIAHVPIITAFDQYHTGSTVATSDSTIVRNGKQVRDLFQGYNVQAVLQGHTHIMEEIVYTGTHYITGGAVCGEWWKGPRLGIHPEGFAVFDVDRNGFRWHYAPYGWKAQL